VPPSLLKTIPVQDWVQPLADEYKRVCSRDRSALAEEALVIAAYLNWKNNLPFCFDEQIRDYVLRAKKLPLFGRTLFQGKTHLPQATYAVYLYHMQSTMKQLIGMYHRSSISELVPTA